MRTVSQHAPPVEPTADFRDFATTPNPVTKVPEAMDLIWGAAAIGEIIGRTPKQVFHLLENGHIPPARKLGGKWVVSERLLRAFFEAG